MEEVLDRPFWASWLPLMLWIQLMLISCYFPILVFLSHSIFSTWLPVCSSQVSRINRKSRGFIISLWTRNPDIQMLHKKQPDYSNCPLADETHFAILMFFYCFLKSTIMWRISCFSVRTYIYIYMFICSLTFVDIYIYIPEPWKGCINMSGSHYGLRYAPNRESTSLLKKYAPLIWAWNWNKLKIFNHLCTWDFSHMFPSLTAHSLRHTAQSFAITIVVIQALCRAELHRSRGSQNGK